MQPLSTEGEGLSQYSGRKKYSLTQVCFPVGIGWKVILTDRIEVSYEFGYRFLFTDYFDDVSKSYINLDVLNQAKGPKPLKWPTEKMFLSGKKGCREETPAKMILIFLQA